MTYSTDLRKRVLKYVEDPNDAERELDRYTSQGFNGFSDSLKANLQRDMEFQSWVQRTHDEDELDREIGEQDELEDDDIELEIPGDESTATVDKAVQAKATKQDQIIKDFKRLQDQMKTHLELYKTSEAEENKQTALQMLKKLTPEFQAAKKKYEKLKGVKL